MKDIAIRAEMRWGSGVLYLLCLLAVNLATAADGPMGVERVARLTYAGYQSSAAGTNDAMHWVKGQPEWVGGPRAAGTKYAVQWVQVDLGRSVPIDKIKLFPLVNWSAMAVGFPARFKIEVSDDRKFKTCQPHYRSNRSRLSQSCDEVSVFPGDGKVGRYVRLTTTRLRDAEVGVD